MTAFSINILGVSSSVSAASVVIRRLNRAATECVVVDAAVPDPVNPSGPPVQIAADVYYRRGAGSLVGKWMYCYHGGTTIFRGIIVRAARRKSRGGTVSNTITAKAGWYFLERIPYVQKWKAMDSPTAEAPALIASNRVVLNQREDGSAMSAWEQIDDILSCAKLIYPNGVISWADESGTGTTTALSVAHLPFDEMRDATCAQALERVLRFFPDISVAFDSQFKIMAFRSAGLYDATAYVDNYADQIKRIDEATDSFIDGVRVEILKTGTINGKTYSLVTAQTAGETGGINVLHGTLELSGRDASRSKQRLDAVTEALGDIDSPTWWKEKCPQVFGNVAAGDIVISDAGRSGEADKANYPRLAVTPMQDIVAAGMLARVETFSCLAEVTRRNAEGDVLDVEKDLPVQIKLVTTNATTRTYTYTTAFSSTSGDPEPEGLAGALLAAHAGDGMALQIVARIPDSSSLFDMSGGTHYWLPEPGDAYAGMIAQSVVFEFPSRTMTIDFGPATHLSIQDMAGMMSGFRARRTTSVAAKHRDTGEIDSDEIPMGVVAPAEAVQSGQGRRERFVVAIPDDGPKIDSDPAKITSETDKEMQPREITVYKKTTGGLQAFKLWVMATAGADDGSAYDPDFFPNGTQIPGRVVYIDSSPPYFAQYSLTWNSATKTFTESANPTRMITDLESHSSQHA